MPEEKTGYHKGALETLLKERAELSRMLNIVNSLVENHAQVLEESGVDVEDYISKLRDQQQKRSQSGRRQKAQGKGNGRETSKESSEVSNMLEGGPKGKNSKKSRNSNKGKDKKKDSSKNKESDYSFQ